MLRRGHTLTLVLWLMVACLLGACTSASDAPSTTSIAAQLTSLEEAASAPTSGAQRAAVAELADWKNVPCPAGGSVEDAFFAPLPNDGATPLDFEPANGWTGYEIVRVIDLHLPEGIMAESDGVALGDGHQPVRIAEPGTYPFFMALSVYPDHQVPAFGQLVLDAGSAPVRWVVDDRLGFTTDLGSAWLGSPSSAVAAPSTGGALDQSTWQLIRGELSELRRDSDTFCTAWQRGSGANFVQYSNGGDDGYFPAVSGYDADGQLVAVVWSYGTGPWTLAGIAGTPPAQVQAEYAAN